MMSWNIALREGNEWIWCDVRGGANEVEGVGRLRQYRRGGDDSPCKQETFLLSFAQYTIRKRDYYVM